MTSSWVFRLRNRQHGAASLAVVMLLFLVISLAAAYLSRNLIFEQRTSVNQTRSTQAFEAAEAGLEWAIAMLNSGRVDDSCKPIPDSDTDFNNPQKRSFRDRFVRIEGSESTITVGTGNNTAAQSTHGVVCPLVRLADGSQAKSPLCPVGSSTSGYDEYRPGCVLDGSNWKCSCSTSVAVPTLPATAAGSGANEVAYRVRFVRLPPPLVSTTTPPPAGVIEIQAVGCTRSDDRCLSFDAGALSGEGKAMMSAHVALIGGVAAPPVAAVTVKGGLNLIGGASIKAVNKDVTSSGFAVRTGGSVLPGAPDYTGLSLEGPPGTPMLPSRMVLTGETQLANAAALFASVHGVSSSLYQEQPAAVVLDGSRYCSSSGCTGTELKNAVDQNPGRVFWIPGNLTIDTSGQIGSAERPVAIVLGGNLTFQTAATINGSVYALAGSGPWVLEDAAGGTIKGALVVDRSMHKTGAAATVIEREPLLLGRVRRESGSFVRVPGTWKDFQ